MNVVKITLCNMENDNKKVFAELFNHSRNGKGRATAGSYSDIRAAFGWWGKKTSGEKKEECAELIIR
jgi:hypothetical protein